MSIVKDFITRAGIIIQGTQPVSSSTGQLGSLQVDGGAAIAKNIIVGTSAQVFGPTSLYSTLNVIGHTTLNSVTIDNSSSFLSTVTFSSVIVNDSTILSGIFSSTAVNTFNGPVYITGTNSLVVGSEGNLEVYGNTDIFNNTTATLTGDGALKVTGGVYIDNNLVIKGDQSNTGTTASNSLYVAGGAWIDKSLVVGGPTLFQDTVVFNGTATYVYSTNTYYTDNIINLHIPPGGIEELWPLDDGKDIGFKFHYYSDGDANAALVLANDTKWLEWYSSGAEGTSTFVGASYGTFKTGAIVLASSTGSNSTQTGALQVVGGIGVGENIFAGGNISGDTLSGRNLTENRLVLVGPNSELIDTENLYFNTSTNSIVGVISTATYSINIKGGATGSIPYQISTDTTELLPIGATGFVLSVENGLPAWKPASETAAGFATTASNIKDGGPGQIVYQISSGVTGFVNTGTAGQLLQSNGTSGPSFINTGNVFVGYSVFTKNILNGLQGAIPIQTNSSSTAFIAPGSDDSYLRHDGTTATFVTTGSIFVGKADTALNLNDGSPGQIPYQSSTGTTAFTGPGQEGEILVSKGVNAPVFQNTLTLAGNISSLTTDSGTLQVIGGVGVSENLNVGNNLSVKNNLVVGTETSGTSVNALYSNNILLSSYTSPIINSTSSQVIDSLNTNSYRTARYTVQVINSLTNVHISEVVMFHDNVNVYVNEYGIITNNGELGSFNGTIGSNLMNLTFTPISTSSTTIKVVRMALSK
jgi:hypothetical protein